MRPARRGAMRMTSGVRAARRRTDLAGRLGPGLITGAADDDPSGVATYSQAGAQFGLNMLWTLVLTFPLMLAIQVVSARIGRVTGRGLAANLLLVFPRAVVIGLVGLLFVANTINIGADLTAMGAAAHMVAGGPAHRLTLGFAALCLVLQVFVPYHRYAGLLKWLTFALLAYVAVIFTVHVDWREVAVRVVVPQVRLSRAALLMAVAIFGTTISPYLFFWESAEEVEDEELAGERPLLAAPLLARAEFARITWDNVFGMGVSNLIAFFVMLATALTLHAHGVTRIETAEQAAGALRPIAGDAAFVLFSLGLVGAGLLATPVLAGSAAYALADLCGWRHGLERPPQDAPGFYAVIAAATLLGLLIDAAGVSPIRALVWSAVINGVIAAPVMLAMMWTATRPAVMGRFSVRGWTAALGWAATLVMALTVAMTLTTLL